MTPPDDQPGWTIRPATRDDSQTLANLIQALARYEKLEHEARATCADLERSLFGPRPYAEALIAESAGQPVGFALYFHTFSTFEGSPTLYLEDLFVQPDKRGLGIGKGLFRHVAALAHERGCRRMEWAVLDWNEPAIRFYRAHGARPMNDWTTFRLDGEALLAFGPAQPSPNDDRKANP